MAPVGRSLSLSFTVFKGHGIKIYSSWCNVVVIRKIYSSWCNVVVIRKIYSRRMGRR